ncbi:hypothetical protein P378_17805 [Desulforamulus profundi]|uniref:Uncharacterized protein n=1 Tax=Desulforamulus profundi TaxID=1383067 RepID=A0A2C6MCC4_9FIRM|nr:hypothetical protein P378_17805 [Desulforamulus profundi]
MVFRCQNLGFRYGHQHRVLGYSIAKTREQISDRQVPQLGVMAAFIFAAQMINFPIAGGTSGHLLGAALATACWVHGVPVSFWPRY